MRKINWKKIFIIICWFLIGGLLIYTRFINLSWGLPYPMHPDERNMAWALMNLSPKNWFKPDFFAYGQLPLYLGYILIQVYKLFSIVKIRLITFEEAIMGLRTISALASIINAFVLVKIVFLLVSTSKIKKQFRFYQGAFYILIFIFTPYFIQFSHFGTTESLLMLFYSMIVYQSVLLVRSFNNKRLKLLALYAGLAIATKASSAVFLALPLIALFFYHFDSDKKNNYFNSFINLVINGARFVLLAIIFSIFFSPYNFISLNEFLGSMRYESDVAFGRYLAFYIRQFMFTTPVIFQAEKIFPYVLGYGQYFMAIAGFLLLSWKKKEINLLRLAFFAYFLPCAMLFSKWTRFMTPALPLMTIFAILFILRIKIIKSIKIIIVIIMILPGISYLSVYRNPDVRFTASDWIYKNIPNGSYILSETANVVDIPFPTVDRQAVPEYKVISFNFYDLDISFDLPDELNKHLSQADYIFIPSRRIFANHTCSQNNQFLISNFQTNFKFPMINFKIDCKKLQEKYPLLNQYYEDLFSGKLGFKKIAEFNSYPKISFFGRTLIKFSDEEAEETWTVFDHPVIRIYKRV